MIGPPKARVHFYSDDEDCPTPDLEKCRRKSYLIPGDQVIVSKIRDNMACSWYQPQKGSETVGWIPLESLSVAESDENPSVEQWAGSWKYYDQTLNIAREGNTRSLFVKGEAYWHGLGDNIHIGGIEAKAEPNGNELNPEEDECRIVLRLIGNFIVVRDNSQCGGANVRFNGIYRKN